jgi:hypothetical protein
MAESIQTSLASINMKLEYIQKDVKELKDNMHDYSERVVQLEKDGLTHGNACPQNKELGGVIKRVDCIEKDLEEYRIAKKYPRLVLVLILVFSLLALGTGIATVQKIYKEIDKFHVIEQTATDLKA